eukprot:1206534-Karenia_brevis.AAC.1
MQVERKPNFPPYEAPKSGGASGSTDGDASQSKATGGPPPSSTFKDKGSPASNIGGQVGQRLAAAKADPLNPVVSGP